MGRRSVPFADESAMLGLGLCEVLEMEDAARSLVGAWRHEADDEEDEEDEAWMATPSPAAPAGLTIEDLYRINRNRARIVRLLHSHRSFHGAPIIIVTPAAPMDGWDEDEARHERLRNEAWFAAPADRAGHAPEALTIVH